MEQDYNNNNLEGLTIKDILVIIKKHIFPILILVFGGAIVGCSIGILAKVKRPKYTAHASMLVTSQSGNILEGTTTQYQLSYNLLKTYSVFVKEDVVIDKVINKINIENAGGGAY